MDNKNLGVIKQQFAQCVFNHKIFEVATERFEKYLFRMNIWNIVLVSFTLIFLVIQIKTRDIFYSNIAIWITIAEVIYLIIQLQFNFSDKVRNYKNTALGYLWLRDKYKNFISDIVNQNLSKNQFILIRDTLQSEYQIINKLSFQTNRDDYTETQRRLKTSWNNDEDFTWSDREINKFLPKELR